MAQTEQKVRSLLRSTVLVGGVAYHGVRSFNLVASWIRKLGKSAHDGCRHHRVHGWAETIVLWLLDILL
jgi:hypothetical protein